MDDENLALETFQNRWYTLVLSEAPMCRPPDTARACMFEQSALVVWFYLQRRAAFWKVVAVSVLSLSPAPAHEQMPHNAIASQAASTALRTPLAPVRLKETENFPNFMDKKYKCWVTINDRGERVHAGNRK